MPLLMDGAHCARLTRPVEARQFECGFQEFRKLRGFDRSSLVNHVFMFLPCLTREVIGKMNKN